LQHGDLTTTRWESHRKVNGRILKGEKPENIPTIFMTDPSDVDLLINLDVAKRLNINIADDIKKKASRIIENGKLIKK
jgi:putative ABC transport system substrate-binding protein